MIQDVNMVLVILNSPITGISIPVCQIISGETIMKGGGGVSTKYPPTMSTITPTAINPAFTWTPIIFSALLNVVLETSQRP